MSSALPKRIRWAKRQLKHFDPAPLYRRIIYSLTRGVYKPRYLGLENIPEHGGALLICNHVSYMDGPIISAGIKRHVRFIIEEDIYNQPGVKYFMSMDRAIPIAPNRKAIERAMDAISEGLKAGDLICIFPEGYLTFTGGLGRFKPGIEWMLKRDPVPVIPMALSGLWGSIFSRRDIKHWYRWLPHRWVRGRITLICGPAIPPDQVNINQLQDMVLKLKYSIKD
ncbi:MAG: 1-acyl-sn-glycerol-3-phosphate acyltransferase [Rickettsiales bacterium]|nr:1-acyl-sn-glycerol-3-phosphate acyltransferase [Rickettsiales bacterium]